MADSTINGLSAADALDGTEEVPVWQGSTKKTTVAAAVTFTLGVTAGKAAQVDQAVTAWTRSATTTLGTTLNGTLSDTSTTITAFNGVAGVTYHVRCLGAGAITHHGTNLIITQSGASIAATAAGDTFDVEMITATTCRIKNYLKADGTALVGPLVGASQTWTGQNKFNNFIDVNNAIAAAGNAATVPVTYRLNTVTNNSAATLTITMTTASAVDGQMTIVRILDATAVAQTITWVNTEDSTVAAPTTSNGSTTLFKSAGFIFNGGTSLWRCIASA